MPRGKAINEEARALVMAALLSGLGVNEVARQYQLPKSTVSRIRAELGPRLEQVGTEVRASLDDLLLNALSANLNAQARIAEAVSEPTYITQQPASSVADLYETLADKAIRLLEAASLGSTDASEETTVP